MILLAFRHGLRAAEVCDLRWDQVDFKGAVLHVRRVKSGSPSTHPIQGDELRALRRLQRESPTSPFVFVSERGSPFTTAGFARMIERAAVGAGLELKATPTCCGMPAAMHWPTKATTRGRSRAGSAIARSPAQRSTRRWRRTASRTSGEIRLGAANHRRFQISGAIPGGGGEGM
jgi:integrase